MTKLAIASNIYFRFIIINLVFLMITAPFITLFGPFDNIKRSVVGAVLTSRHPHYITWIFSEKEIKEIVGEFNPTNQPKQDLFQFTKRETSSLRLVNINATRFTGYMLEIPDPTRVKAATAQDIQEKGDTTSSIGIANNAVAAINAGGFYDPNGTGTGRLPYGVIINEGKFLIGGDIKEQVQLIGVTKAGVLVAGNYTPKEMREMNVAEGVSFGPPLIINGKKLIKDGDGDGGWGVAPRTAIGQRKDGTILLLVIDGRQPGYSLGATLLDVQNILYEQGAYVAANLDGGSSTTLYYNGKVVNKPCDMLGERMIPTAFIVK
ncbi:phosphodiester glycosidase family protein [Anaerospora sp.]|uniref:phosphodiester glycosidase family protein n=1 Tax=Anaerospora sp. TaxID=1960278 RepID=UPI0028A00A81|nr:phosphodiester glycosidase family protein [Anaerospora sp.]